MKFSFAPLATVALMASGVLGQAGPLTINTPTGAVVCQPILLTWTGGTPPYFLSLLPGNQPGAQPLVTFDQQTGNSLTWIVNVAAGTSVGLTLRDSTGQTAQSAAFTPNAGTSTDCVGQNPSSSSSPSGPSSSGDAGTTSSTAPSVSSTSASSPIVVTTTSGTPGTTAPAPSTSAGPRPSTTGSGSSAGTGSSTGTGIGAPAASTSSNGASANAVQIGVAGMIGAAVIAILA